MTRDARLSALHRGDFRPGAALPSPALPPDPCSDAPRSQVVVAWRAVSRTSRARGYEPRPQDATPRSAFRIVSRRRPSMSEDGNLCTINSLRSQHIYSNCSRRDGNDVAPDGSLHAFLASPGNQRTNIRNPGWSPTTVMCPLQGAVSSNRNTLPGRSCLVSPSVTVMEKLPCKTMPN